MGFYIKDKLDQVEHEKILKFLSSLSFYCIEQHPDWDLEYDKVDSKNYFFFTNDKNDLQCFANIFISKKGLFKVAYISFGPAFEDHKVLTNSIRYIYNYFSKQGFIYLSIQLCIYINEKSELLEYEINENFKVNYYFKPGNLWSSLIVDLTKTESEIFKSFSKGHKSSIKAGIKSGLKITIQKDYTCLNEFIELYIKMYEFRKLIFNKKLVIKEITNIFTFINKHGKGFIECIYDKDILVGALIVLFQGNSVRYFKSVSDPERKDLSIMHLGLYEAMKYCKNLGFINFDLWGYNHLIDKKNQLFYVNMFKKGFSDNFIFFPKEMNFVLKPFLNRLYLILKFLKKNVDRLLEEIKIRK